MASTQLTNHEDGHRQIEEHVKDLAKARFQAESAKILDKNLDDATVTGMINAVKDTLIKIMAKCTGQPEERIRDDSERDRFFDAQAAVKYGICDEVIGEDSSGKTAEAAADGKKPK